MAGWVCSGLCEHVTIAAGGDLAFHMQCPLSVGTLSHALQVLGAYLAVFYAAFGAAQASQPV